MALFSLVFGLFDYAVGFGLLTITLHLTAAFLFVSPAFRAIPIARALPAKLREAFGDPQRADGLRLTPRRAPLVASDLPHIPLPEVDRTRHVYREVDGLRLALDLYRPSEAGRCPAMVVVVHGGSWSSGDNTQLMGLNRYLTSRGYGVAAINYRLAPEHRFPAAYEDIVSSIEFMKDRAGEFDIDASRTVVLGRSSGGHLALLAGYVSSNPSIRGVVAVYSPTDMKWSWDGCERVGLKDAARSIEDFLGGTPSEVPDAFDRASPIGLVTPNSPPTLILHGGADEHVSPLQSHRLVERLRTERVPYLHVELPWAHHGMDANHAGPSGQITTFAIEHFLSAVTV